MIRSGFLPTLLAFFVLFSGPPASAHEIRPALLSLREIKPEIYEVAWHRPVVGNRAVPMEARFPTDCIDAEPPHLTLTESAAIFRYTLDCNAQPLRGQEVHIDGLTTTLTDVLLKIDFMSGTDISHVIGGRTPFYTIPVSPKKHDIASAYIELGVLHILGGWDHLMFVLALAMLIRSRRGLVSAITGFTLAHSLTLGLVVLGVVLSPGAIIEVLIAMSVVFLAYEARRIDSGASRVSLTQQFPMMITALFGLLHGFGFAGALMATGLPIDDIPLSLLSFNLGIELGQLMFIAIVVSVDVVLKSWADKHQLAVRALMQYSVGSIAAFWIYGRLVVSWV